ncbi:MAG TPA: hypothetical protein VFE45_06875 [Coriobacteriia bacterium]|nr:hypothetical protein [Coriobacteriia bacterium]
MHMDTGFRPSTHGFGFPNAWHDLVLGAITSRGRCGGMVFAALDRFAADVPLTPAEQARALPDYRAPLARHIWRRQVESIVTRLGSNLMRFALLTYLPSHAPKGTARTRQSELPRVLAALEVGQPVPLGLVSGLSVRHLAQNHQVLAYAADVEGGLARIRIYDPNFPHRDDVVLEVPIAGTGPVMERAGARTVPWRGFFAERYTPAPVPGVGAGARAQTTPRATEPSASTGTVALLVATAVAGWLLAHRRKR